MQVQNKYTDEQLAGIYKEVVLDNLEGIKKDNLWLERYLENGFFREVFNSYPRPFGGCASRPLLFGERPYPTLGIIVPDFCVFNTGKNKEIVRAVRGELMATIVGGSGLYSIIRPDGGAFIAEPHSDIMLKVKKPFVYLCEYVPEDRLQPKHTRK